MAGALPSVPGLQTLYLGANDLGAEAKAAVRQAAPAGCNCSGCQ